MDVVTYAAAVGAAKRYTDEQIGSDDAVKYTEQDLTEAQKKYAATDAWACIRLYEEMQRMQREGYSITQTHSEEKEKMEI